MLTFSFIENAKDFKPSAIDIVLGLILVIGLIKGLRKGFIIELTSLISLIAGIYGAIHFSYFTVDFIDDYMSWNPDYINLIAFILTFIIIVVGISILGKLITKTAELIQLGMLNKLLGAIFGVLKTGFVLGIILLFFSAFNTNEEIIEHEKVEASVIYPSLEKFGESILPSVVQKINEHSPWEEPIKFNR